MKTLLAATAAVALLGSVSIAHAGVLYYGGDFDPSNANSNGLANEVDASVSDAATYDNFTVTGTWTVTDLFTNDLTDLSDITSANWEIRTGVSEGNGGALVASGSATPTITDTGLNSYGLEDYTVDVPVSLTLTAGTYWLSVVPVDTSGDGGRSYNANTFGLNAVGVHTPDEDYFNSGYFGADFTNADNEGTNPTFSAGVLGTASGTPEPATWALMLIGFGGLGASLRSRRNAVLAKA